MNENGHRRALNHQTHCKGMAALANEKQKLSLTKRKKSDAQTKGSLLVVGIRVWFLMSPLDIEHANERHPQGRHAKKTNIQGG